MKALVSTDKKIWCFHISLNTQSFMQSGSEIELMSRLERRSDQERDEQRRALQERCRGEKVEFCIGGLTACQL